MAITYVDWRNPYNRVPYSSDIRDESNCTEFYEEGEEFLTFYNEDNGKYAVYYKLAHGGALCSLVEHFDTYSRLVDTDDGLSDELYRVIAKHAIDCGFPPTHPPMSNMTWRQLIAEVQKVPKEFLDTPAYVWRPDGGGTLATVRGVMPWVERYDGTVPGPGGEGDNCYFIDNGFPDEE